MASGTLVNPCGGVSILSMRSGCTVLTLGESPGSLKGDPKSKPNDGTDQDQL